MIDHATIDKLNDISNEIASSMDYLESNINSQQQLRSMWKLHWQALDILKEQLGEIKTF